MSTVRSTRCRTGGASPYRWMAVLTVFAMFVFAGIALADASNQQGAKLVRPNHDGTQRKIGVVDGDGNPVAPNPPVHSGPMPLAPPSNDDCTGAIAIPAPPDTSTIEVTAPVDITDATPQDVDETIMSCATVDRTVWYTFTPTISGQYVISSCGTTATGDTVYDTVIAVYDSTAGCPSGGAQLACSDSAACSTAVAGAPYTDQGTVAPILAAGTTYYVVAGHWSQDLGGVSPGFNNIVVSVQLSPAPRNDNCNVAGGGYAAGGQGPAPLALDRITFGTTASATNDYRSIGCPFPGPGQLATTSNGLDVVFSFEAPTTDLYSFRYVQDDAGAALRSQSPSLYLSTQCPSPDPTIGVAGCFAAANRMNDQTTGNGNRSEEINCVQLTGGTTYYLFFDDRFTGNNGGPLAVEVTRCKPETEPNDTTATATPYAPNSGCWMEGGAIPSGPAADIDFYDLGAPPAGSKIYVAVDSAASTTSDYQLRVTNSTDTLGFDDNDGSSWIGSNAPVVAGPIADGGEIFAEVNGKTVSTGMQPYHLYARIETGAPILEDPELQPNGPTFFSDIYLGTTRMTGTTGQTGGILSTLNDLDCFQFTANEGQNIAFFADNDPARTPGTITNAWPVMYQMTDNPTPSATRFVGQVVRNIGTPGPGAGLSAVTPSVTSNFAHYRARYTGVYIFCWRETQDINTTDNPPANAYPLPWGGDVTVDCAPPAGPQSADVAITKTGPAGPVQAGSIIDYTITITNNEASAIAEDIELLDTLPAGTTFVALTVTDPLPGNGFRNHQVLNLPTPGQNDAPVDVVNVSIAPGASIVYTLTVQVTNCQGAGHTILNTATISGPYDLNSLNNTASWSFTTSDNGTCTPTICDTSGCIVDNCQTNNGVNGQGACDPAGACVGQPLDCDDHSVCTADSCDPTNPTHPCVNDSSQLGDLCFDGNDCTFDTCDPVSFCAFPPKPQGVSCNDFLNCTHNDVCNGQGVCFGTSVCDDGLPCTDDFADEANNCACDHATSFPGTPCDDGNACTTGSTCDGSGGTVAACTGGSPVSCDDGNPCTDDACDPSSGCTHTPNTAACDDGNVCTVGDTCGGGTCNPGAPANCDDGNGCTDDSCDTASGCVHANNSNPCSDGNACTTGDVCSGGQCVPGGPTNCDDGDCCTIDGCNPSTGCTHTPNPTTPVFTTQPSLSQYNLWSPNHGYVDFTVADTGAAASSACGISSISFASCSSSQPENAIGTGDGNTLRDCVYSGGTVSMRAERDGGCSPIGRLYTTRLIAVDACGHTALSNTTSVPVWHDRAHPPVQGTVRFSTGNSQDVRAGTNGTYGTDCGTGGPTANGSIHDHSDADPEMEISQGAAVDVNSLRVGKNSGNVVLTWTAPVQIGQVTRFHVWQLDPMTLFWTQIAEVTKQTTSFTVTGDASSWQYKVSAVIK